MALVWADGFDQYGTAIGANAFMLNAGYTTVNISSWQPGRTGANSIQLFSAPVERPLATPVASLGIGCAIAALSCNAISVQNVGFNWFSAGPNFECGVTIMPDNSLGVWDRTFTLKGQSAPNTLVSGSFQWVEAKATGNVAGANTGKVEVRVNGVVKVIVNGLNLPNIFTVHRIGGSINSSANFDDYVVWDTTGTKNNDFLGDRALFLSFVNANAALQDFTPVPAGNAWDRLNDDPPSDAAYIEGTAVGNISEFTKSAIGIAANDIAAIVVLGRLFKSDAGVASGRIGINSAGTILNSAEIFPGTTGANSMLIVENNPNGNIPWTKAAADAANPRVTRVS